VLLFVSVPRFFPLLIMFFAFALRLFTFTSQCFCLCFTSFYLCFTNKRNFLFTIIIVLFVNEKYYDVLISILFIDCRLYILVIPAQAGIQSLSIIIMFNYFGSFLTVIDITIFCLCVTMFLAFALRLFTFALRTNGIFYSLSS